MSYQSVLSQGMIETAFDLFDRLLPEAQNVLRNASVGPMQTMSCGLDHTIRAKRFTGTDLPKMFGFIDEKYGDLRTVLAEKLGILKPEFTESVQTRIGKYMEPYLASQAILQYHEQIEAWGKQGPIYLTFGENHQHDSLNLACSTDLCVYLEEELKLIAEFKHTRADWDTPPDKVLVQVQAQMMCAKQPGVTVFGLTGGNSEDKIWPLAIDPKWVQDITDMVKKAEEIRASGVMPAVLSFVKPVAPKKRPVAQVPPTWVRLGRLLAQKRNEMDAIKKQVDRMNDILSRHFQLGASYSDEMFSASKSLTTSEPKLNADKALTEILGLVLPIVPKNVQEKIDVIKQVCTKDGSQSERFTVRRKGEK